MRKNLLQRIGLTITAMFTVVFGFGCASTDTEFGHAPNDARYDYVNPAGMRFVYVPAGEFEMGSPHLEWGRRNNELQHTVRLTNGYYIGVFEVTVGQFKQFAQATRNPGGLTHVAWQNPGFHQSTNDHPVTNVSWHDAMAFCQWLGTMDGMNYRLPTEAEWEYAARGGAASAYSNAEWNSRLDDNIDGIAWRKIYSDVTTPVGRYSPNAWGLYDTQGNVMEWTGDYYCRYDEATMQVNPVGPPQGCDRVVRGGHFNSYTVQSRSAYRQGKPPTVRSNAIGFRVLIDPPGCAIAVVNNGECGNCLTVHAVNKPRCADYAPRHHRQYSGK